MCVKIITLPFNEQGKEFDDKKLVTFLKGKQMISKSDYLFEHEQGIYLAVILRYKESETDKLGKMEGDSREKEKQTQREKRSPVHQHSPAKGKSNGTKNNNKKTTYQPKNLTTAQLKIYEQMRRWRYSEATARVIPAYMICSNIQLEKIIKSKPKNMTHLEAIEGMKGAKTEKFGQLIINNLWTLLKNEPEGYPGKIVKEKRLAY